MMLANEAVMTKGRDHAKYMDANVDSSTGIIDSVIIYINFVIGV